jgi:hypothetical protein
MRVHRQKLRGIIEAKITPRRNMPVWQLKLADEPHDLLQVE